MSKWKLLIRATGLRAVLLVALGVALVTLGVGVTVLAGVLGTLPGVFIGQFGVSAGGATVITVLGGLGAWFATALGVARSFLGAVRRLLKMRVPTGTATVGADGVASTHGLRRTFASYRDVVSIRIDGDEVVLVMQSGEERRFMVDEPTALQGVLRAALARFGASQSPAIAELSLERGSDVASWLANVRRILNHTEDYRAGAVTADALERVAEDPTASADQRVGAALALAAGDQERRVRIRVAVADTANPELSEAMEAALEDELTADQLKKAVATAR